MNAASIATRARVALVVVLAAGLAAAGCAPKPKPRPKSVATVRPAPVLYAPYVSWGDHSIASRMVEIGPRARARWHGWFRDAGVSYPAANVKLVVFKREKRVEVFAGPSAYNLSLVRSIPITAASGGPGPKLREGDRQVPEGVYELDKLNPNSLFHVSMRIAYPNAFDVRMASRDGRRKLGGSIMIHGSDKSIGCVAVGDEAAEDLFVLTADSGLEHVTVMIVPRDFRRTGEHDVLTRQPAWVRELYADLDLRLRSLPTTRTPASTGDGSAAGAGRTAAATSGRTAATSARPATAIPAPPAAPAENPGDVSIAEYRARITSR